MTVPSSSLPSQSLSPVILIGGPTASGKSAVAMDLAKRLGGWIINADALQRYRDLSIISARPGDGEMAAVPHRLYGDLDAADPGSAARWRDAAILAIRDAQQAGAIPILVGGTGLYFKALTDGLADIPAIPSDVRQTAMDRVREAGAPQLHAELATLDPVLAARLAPTDTQRVVLGWEVVRATGRPLSDWQATPRNPPPSDLRFFPLCLLPEREDLYTRIDARFAEMISAGALDEVAALRNRNLDPLLPAMKAVGVPELIAALAGTVPLAEAIQAACQASRRYAKRQFTWFRNQWRPVMEEAETTGDLAGTQPCAHGWHSKNAQYPESLRDNFVSFILHSLDQS